MDSYGLVPNPGQNNVVRYTGNSVSVGEGWQVWRKPTGFRMANFFLMGSGGGGGTGVVGIASMAAGGGGGGSSGQTVLEIPLAMLPDVLYLSIAIGKSASGFASYISVRPDTTANHILAIANGGGVGGNGSGGSGGTAGAAGAIATAGMMPLGWLFAPLVLAGQAGIAGGSSGAGAALTLPVTGLRCTGGTGGGGLPASGAGSAGGSFTVPAAPSFFPPNPGGAGGSATTTPPVNGNDGVLIRDAGAYWYGGTGGGSTHATAIGAGLVQARGGNGSFGSGGGGMGGALTTSTAAVQSLGGNGICIVTYW